MQFHSPHAWLVQNDLATHGAEIMGDIPNFANMQPQIRIGRVVYG